MTENKVLEKSGALFLVFSRQDTLEGQVSLVNSKQQGEYYELFYPDP